MSNRERNEKITDNREITDMEETPKGEDFQVHEDMEELERQRRQLRRERIAVMRQKKRRQELLRSWSLLITAGVIVLVMAAWGVIRLAAGHGPEYGEGAGGESQEISQSFARLGKGRQYMQSEEEPPPEGNPADRNPIGENFPEKGSPQEPQEELPEEEFFDFAPHTTEYTVGFPEAGRGVYSTNGILIDVEKEEILACREPYQRINPASMTKILTLLVAAEHVEDLQDTFTMTIEITDYTYLHGCSVAGFGVGEVVTVEELMYGTILPSGADAAMALAEYVAGSQEAFVEMMNQKLEQLGRSDSAHFTNCVGLYDENHYCTVYDMALILKAATDNELCRRIMSARRYTTTIANQEQPEGIMLSNLFLRRIEDKDTHGEVLCAKTGFVDQSGSCAASLAADYEGREYICVTTGSISSWACIYDHVEIYQAFLPAAQE